ncbi:putative rmlD substrate binding domain [Lyophyllum shimeji]|uniref:RmlD substrate binding domain n=1 Tax=Lyophyllum shimeji TaxID=47721 RepID=A0A9P3PQ24_LYOSH|nr:putative rmlD substrate binding domain [Lyophyllum shimeji]
MKIAVTGCNGSVGKRVVELALRRGHTVVGIDHNAQAEGQAVQHAQFTFVQADLKDFEVVMRVLGGSDGVVHLAACRAPDDYKVITHNSNVVISWNVLRACAELEINRIAQASSVNVITMVFSQTCKFEYFPIDELHRCLPDEPYGLSKVICELQAETIVRRYPSMRIASLRLHWSVPSRLHAQRDDPTLRSKDLWGYVQEDSAADAFLLALTEETGKWSGHEAFFIVAPVVAMDEDSRELRERFYPDVPITEGKDVSGSAGFFDCRKAERLLGWVHKDAESTR